MKLKIYQKRKELPKKERVTKKGKSYQKRKELPKKEIIDKKGNKYLKKVIIKENINFNKSIKIFFLKFKMFFFKKKII